MQEVLGSYVKILCRFSGSLPISVEWQKDGIIITGKTRYKLAQEENTVSLEIHQLEKTDGGEYNCKLTNKAGFCECQGLLMVKGQKNKYSSSNFFFF